MEPIGASFLDYYETGGQKVDDDDLNPLTISSYLGEKVNAFICSLMNLVFQHLFPTNPTGSISNKCCSSHLRYLHMYFHKCKTNPLVIGFPKKFNKMGLHDWGTGMPCNTTTFSYVVFVLFLITIWVHVIRK